MAEVFKEIDYNSVVDVQDIMDNFNILRLAINNISLTDTEITVVAKKKMLNLVLKELEESIKLVSDELDQLELKDTAIDVVAEEKKLNVVLSELRSEDKKLWQELNGYVARHKVANDNIQKSIND